MDDLQAESWLAGTTNQIVTQSKNCPYDLLVNVSCSLPSLTLLCGKQLIDWQIENESFIFPDPQTERIVGLTPADRKWMDDVVKAVEETWDLPDGVRAQ